MGIKYKNGNYFIDYRAGGKRFQEKVGPNKRMAEEAYAVRRAAIAQGRFELSARCRVKFSDFAQDYLKFTKINKVSWTRDVCALKTFMPFFGSYNLNAITPFMVESYKLKRSETVKPGTINRELAIMKHMFNMAIMWGKAVKNPVKGVKFLRERNIQERVLSPEEIEKLLAACSDHSRPVVLTAVHTGMRINEILSLKWAQVDLENGVITVLNSKNGMMRKVPVGPTLLRTLSKLKTVATTDHVFIYARTNSAYSSIRTAWLAALRRSGVAHCTLHTLRHTYASTLVASGVDLTTVKELLGHQSIVMTSRYSHATSDTKKRAIVLLEQALSPKSGYFVDTLPKLADFKIKQLVARKKFAAVAQLVERRTRNA